MSPKKLVELLRARPFKPLRLHLADGRVREIRHPEMALVSQSLVAIGVPGDDPAKPAVDMTFCSIPNIVEVEPLGGEKPSDNGQKRPKKRRGR